jgi:uncharacterized protein YkwD
MASIIPRLKEMGGRADIDLVSRMTPGGFLFQRALTGAFAVLACALALALAPDRADAADCVAADNEASLLTKGQEARALLCVINKTRAEYGRRPVRRNALLDIVALAHTVKMLATGCFNHTCGGEPTLGARIQKAGFPDCN